MEISSPALAAHEEEQPSPAPAFHQPPPPPQPAAHEGALNELKAEKNELEASYKRWAKRERDLYARILGVLRLQATIFLGTAVVKYAQKADCAICSFMTVGGLLSFTMFVLLVLWNVRLQFVMRRVVAIWMRKRELEAAWTALKQAGATDADLDYWFVDEPQPTSDCGGIIVLSGFMTAFVLANFLMSCWRIHCFG